MAKSANNDVLDGLGNVVKNACTRITYCTSEPTTYTEANATYALANRTVSSSNFTNANRSGGGRQLNVDAASAVSVGTSGTVQHEAFLDVSGARLLYVTTVTSQAVSSGGTLDAAAHAICKVPQPT